MTKQFCGRCSIIAGLSAVMLMTLGCSEDKGNAGNAANRVNSPEDIQKAKDRIQSDPNMPQQAKAAALSALNRGQSAKESAMSQTKPVFPPKSR